MSNIQLLPIKNISKVTWLNNKITIIYKDGTKLIANADEIELIGDYKNENDIPLNDHCL